MTRLTTLRSRLTTAALATVAVITVGFVTVTQLLALVPVSWTMPLLQWSVLQFLLIILGTVRDTLGIWNVLIALLGVLCAGTMWRRARHRRPFPIVLGSLGSAAMISAIASTTVLTMSVATLGVPTSALMPELPFTGFGGSPTRTVTIGTAGSTPLRADLYLPTGAAPREGWPVVVSIHGGGFSTGTRGPNAYTGFLPSHGYAVLDVDYRLASSTYHPWRTQVEDIGCSLAWINTSGSALHLDSMRIATLGLSSGGNLAVNAAYMSANHTLASSCNRSAAIPVVRAVVAGYPAVDLTGIGDRSAIGRLVEQWYVGGTPTQFPDRYRFTDSVTHISADTPPTLIYQGSQDHLVFADRARHFATVLAQRHVTHQYVEYPGLEHGAGDANGTLTAAAAASRQLALEWLQHHDR